MIGKIYDKFVGLWQDDEALGTRAVRGSVLLFISRSASKLILFVRTILVARLLFPHDIGLFSLATLIGTIAELPLQTGFYSAMVQEKGDVREHLDSAWTVNVIRGFILAGIIFAIAPLGGAFFHNDAVTWVARSVGILYIITGFENIGVGMLQREMKFNRKFFYDIGGTVAQVAGIIVAALILHNVWALVIGNIIGRLGYLVLSYVMQPYRPWFHFNLAGAKQLYKFGKWIGISGTLSFFVAQGDALTVARLIDTAHLAFYQMAFSLGIIPAVETVSVLGDVLFPLYANIRDDASRLKSVFLRVAKFIYAFMVPAAVGLWVLAPEVVRFVYGSQWLPMVSILRVVVLYGFIRSFEYLVSPAFHGLGKPKITFFNLLIQSVVMFVLIVPLVHAWGAAGAAVASLTGLIMGQIFLYLNIRKEIHFGLRTFLKSFYLPLIASGLMALVIFWSLAHYVIASFPMLIAYIIGAAIIYFAIFILLDWIFNNGFKDSLGWIKSSI